MQKQAFSERAATDINVPVFKGLGMHPNQLRKADCGYTNTARTKIAF